MISLTVAGVPEHFNYPWYLSLKNKEYTKNNINLRWKDFPGGTGAMCKALRTGEVDIAICINRRHHQRHCCRKPIQNCTNLYRKLL